MPLMIELLDIDMREGMLVPIKKKEGMLVLTQADRDRRVVVKADIDYLASLEEISWSRNLRLCLLKKEITTLGFFVD